MESTPRAIKIFGREPAVWLGIIEAAIATLVVFNLGVSLELSVIIMAFVSAGVGAYTAWATRDDMLGYATGLVKAGAALFAYYGAGLNETQITALVALMAVVVGAYQRTQTTPVSDPVTPSPTQVINLPVPINTERVIANQVSADEAANGGR